MPPASRYPGEGDAAFSAFLRYLLSGWVVSVEALPRKVPRLNAGALRAEFGPLNVGLWFRVFEWTDRATEYDREVSRLNTAALDDIRQTIVSDLTHSVQEGSALLVSEMQRSIAELRDSGRAIPLPLLFQMLERLSKVAVLIQPPSNPEDEGLQGKTAKDLSTMSTEELVRMAQEGGA